MINEDPFIFITARLKSQRLKKKIILPIGKLNLISLLILNLKKEFKSKNIVLITSNNFKDKPLIKIAKKNKINFFCGEPNDVWSADFKGQFKLGNNSYCYPLTITDNFSRFIIACDGYLNPTFANVQKSFDNSFEICTSPCPLTISGSCSIASSS